jgi:hypothetical protein
MKTKGFLKSRPGVALLLATVLHVCAGAVHAAPVTYTFQSTVTTPLSLFGSDPAVTSAAIAALGPNPVISGSFTYDSAAPLTIAPTATSSSVYASSAVPSLSNFTATVGGFTFSDTIGLVAVGNNKTFGNPNTDSVQLLLDSSLAASSVPRTFTPVALGISQVVNVRLFWFTGGLNTPNDFLNDENLPAVLPPPGAGLARISLDFGDPAPGSTFIHRSGVLLDGVVVTAVPEPEIYALLLTALAIAYAARRNAPRRRTLGN